MDFRPPIAQIPGGGRGESHEPPPPHLHIYSLLPPKKCPVLIGSMHKINSCSIDQLIKMGLIFYAAVHYVTGTESVPKGRFIYKIVYPPLVSDVCISFLSAMYLHRTSKDLNFLSFLLPSFFFETKS